MKTTTVMIPTYNESGNIGTLLEQLLALKISGHTINILVVDDKSPDGTAQIVEKFAAKDSRVKLLVRTNERGRGSAGIAGFKTAMKAKSDYIIEMDADFSHDPKYIPAMLAAADGGADLVTGSRYVAGGSDPDRTAARKILSALAGFYVRTILGLKVKDPTGGFRLYRREVLETIDLDHLLSLGPSIVLETLFKTSVKGFRIAEVPIVFLDRKVGVSKLSGGYLKECLAMVVKMRYLHLRGDLFHS
jgi:dolichol-phosphate mannosyltransferase